jgi:dienelactone hydrolase
MPMMKLLFAALALGAAALSPVAFAAPVSEWIEFASAVTPPTPFALKRAQSRGIELKQESGTPLRGLLVHPEGSGPFPALVLLHGCDGIQPFEGRWAEDLVAWGYAALLVDSHGPRGIGDDCASQDPTAGSRVFDAFGALARLRGLPFIHRTRIGVMGWDTGGVTVMRVMDETGVQQHFEADFAAGAAFYPVAFSMGEPAAPLLLLLGGKDDCAPAARIQRAMREVQHGPFPLRVEVLPDAGHRFDDPRFAEPVRLEQAPSCLFWGQDKGATLAYSQTAHETAVELVRAFLEMHLK